MYKQFTHLIILIISFLPATLLAQWQIESFEHTAEKTQSQSATVKNEEGFELAIFKTAKGIVWMDFSLSDNSFDELSQK